MSDASIRVICPMHAESWSNRSWQPGASSAATGLLSSIRDGPLIESGGVRSVRRSPYALHSCAMCARCSASTSSPKSEVRSRHTEWAWLAWRWVLSYSIRMRGSCTR